MDGTLWIGLTLAILLLGGLAIWVLNRRGDAGQSAAPPPGIAQMGYGTQRWEREVALWRGTLRRLEIQAKYQSPPSEALQRQIDEAKAKLVEAEGHLSSKES